MRPVLILAALSAPGAASKPEQAARDALMDEIERQVRLPARADPLDDYGRHYRFDGKGRVEAVYVLARPRVPRPAGDRSARAGERRWLADGEAPPIIFDGGCMVVNVIFDLKTRKVERVFCNGNG